MIDYALVCSKVATNDTHHLLYVQLQFLLIKTLTLQTVYEISSEWLESLQIVGAIEPHKGLHRTANEYAEERRIYNDLISKNNNVVILNSASRILQC